MQEKGSRCKCFKCMGTGKTWNGRRFVECGHCAGTGKTDHKFRNDIDQKAVNPLDKPRLTR